MFKVITCSDQNVMEPTVRKELIMCVWGAL